VHFVGGVVAEQLVLACLQGVADTIGDISRVGHAGLEHLLAADLVGQAA
jgi:hypothetical protein